MRESSGGRGRGLEEVALEGEGGVGRGVEGGGRSRGKGEGEEERELEGEGGKLNSQVFICEPGSYLTVAFGQSLEELLRLTMRWTCSGEGPFGD